MINRSVKLIVVLLIVWGVLWLVINPGEVISVAAQSDGPGLDPLVSISRIDSNDFPRVSAYVAVIDSAGLPKKGLGEDDFQLSEDGLAVPDASILSVTENDTLNFDVVLAVDLSTFEPESFELVQEVLRSFIEGLSSYDRVAILAFHDEVEFVRPSFSDDKAALLSDIDALEVKGSRTSLNKVIYEAVKIADSPEVQRGAVVVLTNKSDNVREISADDAIQQVKNAGVPIYSICYGDVQASYLPDIARLSRGRHFDISGPAKVAESLDEVETILRQGYEVVFESGLVADEAEHELAVLYQEQAVPETAGFLAIKNPIALSISGIEEGQLVALGDTVPLVADVQAPGSHVDVKYFVDDHLLGQRDNPPYFFDWQANRVGLGSHTLIVEAKDNVNNIRRLAVEFEVVEPIIITKFDAPSTIQYGDLVTATALAEATDGIAKVEFRLNGRHLAFANPDISPYQVTFDSDMYPPMTHTLEVRVTDDLGRMRSTDSVAIGTIVGESPGIPRWVLLLLASIMALFILLAALILFLAWTRKIRERFVLTYPLEIMNMGNTVNQYELRAKDPEGDLKFEFVYDGIRLNQQAVFAPTPVSQKQPKAVTASTAGTSVSVPESMDLRSAGEKVGQAKNSTHKLATWLAGIASFLPFTRSFLTPISGQLRQGEQVMGRAQRSTRRVSQAKNTISSGPTGKRKSAASAPSEAVLRSGEDAVKPTPPDVRGQKVRVPVVSSAPARSASLGWVQTPPVDPGEMLKLGVRIRLPRGFVKYEPNGHQPRRTYSFDIQSRSLEQQTDVDTMHQKLRLDRLSLLHRVSPFLVFLTIVTVTVLLYIVVLSGIGVWV